MKQRDQLTVDSVDGTRILAGVVAVGMAEMGLSRRVSRWR